MKSISNFRASFAPTSTGALDWVIGHIPTTASTFDGPSSAGSQPAYSVNINVRGKATRSASDTAARGRAIAGDEAGFDFEPTC